MTQQGSRRRYLSALAGVGTVIAVGAIITLAVSLFRGAFADTVPVKVISDRAGLVMNPDAKVKMRDIQVGRVASIERQADGRATLNLAIDSQQLHLIPSNVLVDITSTTVFGAKFVELVPPPNPSQRPLQAGQALEGQGVTVELNTVFQQLTSVLDRLEPAKVNAVLEAIASALNGRGEKINQMLSDLQAFLTKIEPSLPSLSHDLSRLPVVAAAYADAAPDLVQVAENSSHISRTLVDEQHNLDALLISTIGLADVGNEVVGGNRKGLTDVLRLLVPTTDLTNQYSESINCTLEAIKRFIQVPPLPEPGVVVSVGFHWGVERYRYPTDLPKINATGDPTCGVMGLPEVPANQSPPFLVTDTGANPWQYGNQQLLVNTDGLKQMLFGPIVGPPRNSAQIGMPG